MMDKIAYRRYLQSPAWHALTVRVRARAGKRCEGLVSEPPQTKDDLIDGRWRRCDQPLKLQVHHVTYARVGAEDLEDLILLCVRCHVLAHLARCECELCGEPIFPFASALWELAEDWFPQDWWKLNAGHEFDAAFDEISWLEQWPYCDYCHHMLSKDD